MKPLHCERPVPSATRRFSAEAQARRFVAPRPSQDPSSGRVPPLLSPTNYRSAKLLRFSPLELTTKSPWHLRMSRHNYRGGRSHAPGQDPAYPVPWDPGKCSSRRSLRACAWAPLHPYKLQLPEMPRDRRCLGNGLRAAFRPCRGSLAGGGGVRAEWKTCFADGDQRFEPRVPGIRKHPKWGAPETPRVGTAATGSAWKGGPETGVPRIRSSRNRADPLAAESFHPCTLQDSLSWKELSFLHFIQPVLPPWNAPSLCLSISLLDPDWPMQTQLQSDGSGLQLPQTPSWCRSKILMPFQLAERPPGMHSPKGVTLQRGSQMAVTTTPSKKSQCTHIILDNADILSQYQLNAIRKNHVHIANPDFIWESIKERRLLDVKNYDPCNSCDIKPSLDEKASSSEVNTDDLFLDNASEKTNVEHTEFYAEDDEMPYFPQDFEVAKYNTLEKVGTDGGQETAVVELQCSLEPADCPFLVSAHFLLADGVQTRRQFTIKKTSADASEYYENYLEELKNQGFLLREHFTPEATKLASEKLQAVSKAEGIILLVKTALKNGETAEQLQKKMTEFYRLIPHKHPVTEEVNLRLLAKKEDLCQLIRDMVNVCETHLSKPNPPCLAKYRALRCKIEHVEPNTKEFSWVKQEVLQNYHSKSSVGILQIFRVGRVNEATEFVSKLGNVRSLLHGSPVRNIVGILSSTSIKYSQPGETDGSRLLVICDVALGKCMDLFKKDFSLTEAPPGYNSVHGVSNTASIPTEFEDDEFVIYKTNQVKMKYIVKFCMPEDQIKDFHPCHNTEFEEYRPKFSTFSKVEDYQLPDTNPSSNVKAGLQDVSGNLIPLEDVHIKGRIMDFIAQVCYLWFYDN
ncbi:Poly [ADP-ribose] polymerase 4 [Sciurus carolinensis]|uniref:Poly [ADP-ribose] polymerase n=1 Tax=Sciurus carolinensis TaxID=30640 RepID=A0AA41MID9_SCICA|nr:Poly [ADP-ribose] polymerase 4 [Sciurus carolinensis]